MITSNRMIMKPHLMQYITREVIFLALLLSAFLFSSAYATTDHTSLITSY